MDRWVIFGFLGQTLFFMRFFFQWIASEKKKESIIPIQFWYFSICGGAVLFTYAVHQKDPVFIVGQTTGLFIYLRNLVLIYRKRRKAANSPS